MASQHIKAKHMSMLLCGSSTCDAAHLDGVCAALRELVWRQHLLEVVTLGGQDELVSLDALATHLQACTCK